MIQAPPSLPDDLIEEVLLRVRADDPASLVRAALACTRWCRLVADPAFLRRRRLRQLQHRRAAAANTPPPMLGFLSECDGAWTHDGQPFARFVPTSSCCPRPRADHPGLRAVDARHGRVLLQDRLSRDLLVVWDPVTGQRAALPAPPLSLALRSGSVKATVLCAARTGASATATTGAVCGDHLDCHGGPFVVVVVATTGAYEDDDDGVDGGGFRKTMFSCTYSSESGAWSEPTMGWSNYDVMHRGRTALVGNDALFIKLRTHQKILKYDLSTQETSLVGLPHSVRIPRDLRLQIELTNLEDGRLGLVRMEESNKLCLWSWDHGRKKGRGDQQVASAGWTLRRAIDLKKLFPLVASRDVKHRLVGVVDGVCVAFMAVEKRGLFTIDMKTGLMNMVSEDFSTARCVVPYTDFCTPALRAPSRDDEPVEDTMPTNRVAGSKH